MNLSDGGKKILCPVDSSEHGIRVLKEAVALTEKFEGHLIVLHVLNERMFEGLDRLQGRIQILDNQLAQQVYENLVQEREEMLRRLIADSGASRVPHTTILQRGFPFREIIKTAEEEEVDLIVLGAVGRGNMLRNMTVGSRAERVFRRAGCNVLFVR